MSSKDADGTSSKKSRRKGTLSLPFSEGDVEAEVVATNDYEPSSDNPSRGHSLDEDSAKESPESGSGISAGVEEIRAVENDGAAMESEDGSEDTGQDEMNFDRGLGSSASIAVGRGRSERSGLLPTSRVSDLAARSPYLIFLVAGFFGIFLLKTLTPVPGWIVTLGAVLAIVSYGVFFGLLKAANRIRIDRVGDNCYYLGLTYTLSSLISALFGIAGSDVGERLLQDFGVALGSTAAGVIMRMVLIQFRDEVDDIEMDARLSLVHEAEAFEKSLRAARNDMAAFSEAIREDILKSHKTMAEQTREHFEMIRMNSTRDMEDLESRRDILDSFIASFSQRSDLLLDSTERLGLATSHLTERMKAIEIDPQTLESAFKRVGAGLSETEEALSNSAESLKRSMALVTSHAARFDEAEERSVRFAEALADIEQTLSKLTQGVEKQAVLASKADEILSGQVEAMSRHAEAASIEGRKMKDATESVYGTLMGLADLVVQGTRRE